MLVRGQPLAHWGERRWVASGQHKVEPPKGDRGALYVRPLVRFPPSPPPLWPLLLPLGCAFLLHYALSHVFFLTALSPQCVSSEKYSSSWSASKSSSGHRFGATQPPEMRSARSHDGERGKEGEGEGGGGTHLRQLDRGEVL